MKIFSDLKNKAIQEFENYAKFRYASLKFLLNTYSNEYGITHNFKNLKLNEHHDKINIGMTKN